MPQLKFLDNQLVNIPVVELFSDLGKEVARNGFLDSYKAGYNNAFNYVYKIFKSRDIKIADDFNVYDENDFSLDISYEQITALESILSQLEDEFIKGLGAIIEADNSEYKPAFLLVASTLQNNTERVLNFKKYGRPDMEPLSLFKYKGYSNNRPPEEY